VPATDFCPNEVQFQSTPDFNQKHRFIIRSQCLGAAASIQEIITNPAYDKIEQVTRKRIIHESGYQICSTKSEIVVFLPKKRRVYAFNLGNTDEYEYNLVELGISQPIMMHCVPEMNLVQIVGYHDTAVKIINYKGGDSESPASRIHSVLEVKGATKGKKITRITTGYTPGNTSVTTLVSFAAATNTLTDKKI
jgi:hypothetical protein